MNMERFPIDATFEVRAAGGKTEIRGYAAVFEQLSGDLGGFREKIAPGAFAGGLGADIRALWNHNPDHVLGRSSAGTLRLREDAKGLRVEIDPPASAAARGRSDARYRTSVTRNSRPRRIGRTDRSVVANTRAPPGTSEARRMHGRAAGTERKRRARAGEPRRSVAANGVQGMRRSARELPAQRRRSSVPKPV